MNSFTVPEGEPIREVMCFVPDFNGGGAERALCNLLKAWPATRRQTWPPVVVVRNPGGELRCEVPDWIELISLDLPSAGYLTSLRTAVKLIRILKRRRPALLISFLSFPLVAVASRLAGCPRFVYSVQNPFAASTTGFIPGKHRPRLYELACRFAASLVDRFWAISPGIAEEFASLFDIPRSRFHVLPNSVELSRVTAAASELPGTEALHSEDRPIVMTAGRLVYQKRIDLAISAIASLKRDGLGLTLGILGQGPLRGSLEALAEDLGVAEEVVFLGFKQNPWASIAQAEVFVLSSDFEGFGNVLIEAMACGVPIVATRAPFGPEYILEDGDCGRLVPCGDVASLAAAIRELIANESLRRSYAQKAKHRAAQFDIVVVSAQFWGYVDEVTNQHAR